MTNSYSQFAVWYIRLKFYDEILYIYKFGKTYQNEAPKKTMSVISNGKSNNNKDYALTMYSMYSFNRD